MTHAQQLHRLGLPAAPQAAPQGPRGLHDVALESVGPIPARPVRRAAAYRLLAHRELRATQPETQAFAAAAIQRAQQVGRPLTETRPAPLGD